MKWCYLERRRGAVSYFAFVKEVQEKTPAREGYYIIILYCLILTFYLSLRPLGAFY